MGKFIGRVLGHLAALIVACVLFFILGIAILTGIGLAGDGDAVKVKDGSVLVVDLNRRITDAPERDTSLVDALSSTDRRTHLAALVDALDRAAEDGRIRAVLVTGSPRTDGYASSPAALREVRAALERVKARKPVIAYSDFYSQRQLLVVAGASEILLHPLGEVQWQGVSSTRPYLKDLLDRFNVRVREVAIGRYKSAGEMFSRSEMSPAEREQSLAYITDAWDEIVTSVAAGRGMEPDALRALAERQPSWSAEEARQVGLVDAVAEYDAVLERLKKLAEWDPEEKTFAQVSLDAYLRDGKVAALRDAAKGAARIAVVYVEGELANGEGANIAQGTKIARELRTARLDDDVKAVVLRVNSPGGGVLASDLIRREVELTKAAKPVVVSMGGLAASGGYWVSTAANVIFADATTLTGSIGVVKMMLQVDGTLRRYGVNMDTVKTGDWADFPAGSREWTEREEQFFTRDARSVYDDFVRHVAERRRLERDRVEEIAAGRIWSGRDAVELGLVDRLGGLREAVRHAAELAGVADNYRATHGPEPKAMDEFLESLRRSLSKEEPVAGAAGLLAGLGASRQPEVRRLLEGVRELVSPLEALDDPRSLYARLPWEFVSP